MADIRNKAYGKHQEHDSWDNLNIINDDSYFFGYSKKNRRKQQTEPKQKV